MVWGTTYDDPIAAGPALQGGPGATCTVVLFHDVSLSVYTQVERRPFAPPDGCKGDWEAVHLDVKATNVLTDGHAFGRGLSLHAVTMAGHRRMRSVQELVQLVARRKVNGSYAETGVWRGGMSIFATAALQLYGLGHRPVYLCDSFNGVPLPRNTSVRTDETAYRIQWYLHVNELHVQKMFQKYGVWSPSVHMVKGFYVHSMPPFRAELQQRGERLAILRLDGDIYDSTVDVLYNLYDLVEVGGFVVIDDFGWGGSGDKHVYGARDATPHAHVPPKAAASVGCWWRAHRP